MEAIDIQKIKNEVAQKYGYQNTLDLLRNFDQAKATYAEINLFINEVILEVAKQVAERQRKICTDNTYKHYFEKGQFIDTEVILNAPSPEIK